jgi:exodeoxyribonuclease-3
MDDGVDDPQARFVAGRFGDLHVISVYVPNGKTIDSDAYQYKLEWLKRLRTYLDTHHQTSDKILICGDYNVAPEEIDVARPDEWNDSVLCHDDARAALRHVEAWGLTDLFRMQKPDDAAYSWWDYRMLGFPKGNGLRIDHVLGTGAMAESVRDAWIDRDERKGKKPSDHAPVVVDF